VPTVVHRERFRPRFASRAHLNIFTAKEQTKTLRTMIAEDFESEQVLYYYIDISTALQMNDGQMSVFHLSDGREVSLLHFDLHCKWSRRPLYGVVTPNRFSDAVSNKGNANKSKWRWQMEAFLDADELAARYGLTEQYLPLSSRQMHGFKAQLARPPKVDQLVLAHTDWSSVQQIKSLKRNKKSGGHKNGKKAKVNQALRLCVHEWLHDIETSLMSSSASLPLLPVVINKNSAHWIEWVQVVRIARYGVFVGISLKRRSHNAQGCDAWSVQSIDLDVGRIFNKYSLVALDEPLYTKAMRDAHAVQNQRYPAISELTWSMAPMAPMAPIAPSRPRSTPLQHKSDDGEKVNLELDFEQALMNSNKSWSRRLSALDVLFKQKLAELEQQLRQFEEQALEHDVERQTSEAMKENYCRTIQDKDEELRRLRDEIAQLKLPQQIVPYHPAQGQQIEELKLSDSAPVFTPSRATTGSFQPSLSGIAEEDTAKEPPNEQRHSALNANAKVYDHHPTIQNNAAISAMAHQIHMAALTTPAAQPYYAPLAHPMQYTMQYTYYASKE